MVEVQRTQKQLRQDLEEAVKDRDKAANNAEYMTGLYQKANETISRYS